MIVVFVIVGIGRYWTDSLVGIAEMVYFLFLLENSLHFKTSTTTTITNSTEAITKDRWRTNFNWQIQLTTAIFSILLCHNITNMYSGNFQEYNNKNNNHNDDGRKLSANCTNNWTRTLKAMVREGDLKRSARRVFFSSFVLTTKIFLN